MSNVGNAELLQKIREEAKNTAGYKRITALRRTAMWLEAL